MQRAGKKPCEGLRTQRPIPPCLRFNYGNIAEGNGRRSDKEFASFLNMAHGSAAEAQSHSYAALDLGYLNQETFVTLSGLLDEVSRMVKALSDHLRSK